MDEELTIKEASASFEIPRSRIATAIKREWLNAEKIKNKWVIKKSDLEGSLEERRIVNRSGRKFEVQKIKNLKITQRFEETFATTGGADDFERLLGAESWADST